MLKGAENKISGEVRKNVTDNVKIEYRRKNKLARKSNEYFWQRKKNIYKGTESPKNVAHWREILTLYVARTQDTCKEKHKVKVVRS